MLDLVPVIGIEIHVELKTKSKMFSSSPVTFGYKPNSKTVDFDFAFPGTMPQVNLIAVKYGIQVCSALNMKIDNVLKFDRKNYFYPDLPKGYQITQQFNPIGKDGYINISLKDGYKKIRIENAHLEEDTAKQIHLADCSLLDFNRCGTPLIEIVSMPDISSGEEAMKYVEAIREIVTYLEVSDGKMENGSLRCDINISLKEKDSDLLGVKTECKNLNSIYNIRQAVDYEIERQKQIINSGNKVVQETRRWDDSKRQTVLMRVKTSEVDYKYFPEPNIVPIKLKDKFIKEAISSMKKLPSYYREELKKQNLNSYQIEELLRDKNILNFYLTCSALNPKDFVILYNFITSDILGFLNKNSLDISSLKFSPKNLIDLVNMLSENKINSKQAKEILQDLLLSGGNPIHIAKVKNMTVITDNTAIEKIVDEVLKENSQVVSDWKNGKDHALGYLLGQVMKKSGGKANPSFAKEMILEKIGPCGKYEKNAK